MEDRRFRGSFTVEAALLMPVILAVVFGVFTLGMAQYDKAVTLSALDRCLVRAQGVVLLGADWDSGEISYERRLERSLLYPLTGTRELSEELTRQMEEFFAGEFRFLTKIRSVEVKVSLTGIQASLVPEVGGPAGALFSGERWSKRVRLLHPEEMVRAFGDRLPGPVQEIPEEEGLEELLEAVREMEEGE